MTPRQQRRLQQKLARKAEKKALRADAPISATSDPIDSTPASATPTHSATPTEPRPAGSACSEAKLLANRANAQLSHGAVTAAGKEKVSQNATRHGLTGTFHVLPGESQASFDKLLEGFLECEKPHGQEEVELVHQMAQASWLSRRSVRLQDQALMAMESGTPEEQKQARKDLSLFLRYMTTHDRAYSRYATELGKRRNERRRAERGFVSQKLRQANENRKNEIHQLRLSIETCKRERREIQNRIAAAKAERLELQNAARKQPEALAAAA